MIKMALLSESFSLTSLKIGNSLVIKAMDKDKSFMEQGEARNRHGISWLNTSRNTLDDSIAHEYFHTLWMSEHSNQSERAGALSGKFAPDQSVGFYKRFETTEAFEAYDMIMNNFVKFGEELHKIKRQYTKEVYALRMSGLNDKEFIEAYSKISISKYGNVDEDEFAAEAFSGYVGRGTPTKYENLIGKLVEKYLIYKEDLI